MGHRLRDAGPLGAALLLAACGASGSPDALPAAGEPIAGLSPGAWTWVDFPDSACEDGSPTGIAVNPGSGPDLLLLLNGGGACWDYFTCEVLGTASRGPFGRPQFEALAAGALPGSILDRALPGNPFADAALVFVPYCTGDIHGGDRVATYAGAGGARTWRHVGHANAVAFARRLAATFPAPRRLVVSGASAGGFGALLNYDTFRHYWPAAEGFLLDDSGPPLRRGAVSQTLLDAWYASWGLGRVLDPLCAAACRGDLSAALVAVASRHPSDRLALLSSLQDRVIAGYFLLGPDELQADLLKLAAEVFDPSPNARYFYVAGSSHTMLASPAAFAQDVTLLDWLGQQVGGDPAWDSHRP
jgi:hypothetical protein